MPPKCPPSCSLKLLLKEQDLEITRFERDFLTIDLRRKKSSEIDQKIIEAWPVERSHRRHNRAGQGSVHTENGSGNGDSRELANLSYTFQMRQSAQRVVNESSRDV